MAVKRAIDITAGQRRTLLALLRKHLPNTTVWAYGSRVRWTARPSSDLDVVAFATAEQGAQVNELREALEESSLPFRVDLFVWDDVPDIFHKNIKAEHVALVKKQTSRASKGWREIPFSDAVLLNPEPPLERGAVYPHVDMAAVNENARSVHAASQRAYSGGGSRFRSGDTLMARITPCLENGKIARYAGANDEERAHGSTEFIVIRGRDGVTDSAYAYYLTRWEKVRSYAIAQMSGTSGRQRVPTQSLKRLTVPVPPLSEQRAIAHILGTLDDKIELNRRMNKTLEEMSRALFKSWFVDFDPVHAKAAGRDTGLPKELSDLFPHKFQNSALGKIPSGWAATTVGESFELTMGQSPPGDTYNDFGNGLPFYQGQRDFGLRFPSQRVFCSKETRRAKRGDTMVSVRAPVGTINMAGEQCAIGRGVAAVRHKSKASAYTFYAMESLNPFFSQFEAEGTVFGSINKVNFKRLALIAPCPRVVSTFETLVASVEERLKLNEATTHTLTNLRDILTGEIFSGRILIQQPLPSKRKGIT